jgi:hypothetical protein
MPWQQLVADVGSEYDRATGVPYYREVQVTVPRQAGKTTLVLTWKVQRCLGWGKPQWIAHTAQTGFDARKKLIEDEAPMLQASPLAKTIKRVTRAAGQEAISFANGSRIDVLATSLQAGHGRTYHAGLIDEAFADTDDRREQALLPTMATHRDAQLMIVSTAGTESSTYLRRKVEVGRQAVADDVDSGVAYFEWSAPDDCDPDDPATWWACHPALGFTIDESVIAHARQTMSDGEFRRAFLNQWTSTDERIIPVSAWDAVNSPKYAGTGAMTFGVDANDDRSAAAIVAVSADKVVEVVEHRAGLGWLAERCGEIDRKQGGSAVWAVDESGPTGSLVTELRRNVATLQTIKGAELSKASAAFYDAVADATIRVRRHPSLDDAVAGAARRISGDAWAWSRKAGSTDSSPLVAASVALWVSEQTGAAADFFLI